MKINRKLHIPWMASADKRMPWTCSQNRMLVTQDREWYKFIAVRKQLNWKQHSDVLDRTTVLPSP
jgi:hypothetical protein